MVTKFLVMKLWLMAVFSIFHHCHARSTASQGSLVRKESRVRRVIAGNDASPEEWPWQAWFEIERVGFTCGGSLIAREWVVTAAHCILKDNPSLYQVTLGDIDRTVEENTEQVFGVKQIIKHDHFTKCYPYNYDIALMQLSRPAQLNNAVNIISLPQQNQDIPPGSECHMTGWGKVQLKSRVSDILQDASMTTVSNPTCVAKLATAPEKGLRHDKRVWNITHNMICAGDAGKTNTSGCYGDSGGPLACKNSTGKWVLHGIVSWGDPDCLAHNHYTVFARVSHFRSWIDSRGKNTSSFSYECDGATTINVPFVPNYYLLLSMLCYFQTELMVHGY